MVRIIYYGRYVEKVIQSCNGPYLFEAVQIHPMPNSNQYRLELLDHHRQNGYDKGRLGSNEVNQGHFIDTTSDLSIDPVNKWENNPTECIKEYEKEEEKSHVHINWIDLTFWPL